MIVSSNETVPFTTHGPLDQFWAKTDIREGKEGGWWWDCSHW